MVRGAGSTYELGPAVHAGSRPQDWIEQVAAVAPVPVLVMDDIAGVVLAHGAQPWAVGIVRIVARP